LSLGTSGLFLDVHNSISTEIIVIGGK